MSDNHQALRSALAEMCKQAAMHNTGWTSEIGETNEWGTQCFEIHGERVQELATAYGESTAAYIAACNPIAIAAILSELEALRKDAEFYRYLKPRMIGADFDWNGNGISALVFEWPRTAAIGGDLDENILAAKEQQA